MTINWDSVATENVAAANPQQFTHAPGAALRGLPIIINQSVTTADIITSIRLNPAADNILVPRIRSEVETGAETGRCYGYFYGGAIPAGTLTIQVNRTEGTTILEVVVKGVTGSTITEVVDNEGVSGGLTNPQVTLTTGGRRCAIIGAMWNSINAMSNVADRTGQTRLHEHDYGNDGGFVSIQTTPGTANFIFGYTASLNRCALVAMAIAEAEDVPPATGTVTFVGSTELPLGTETTGGAMTIPAGTLEFDDLYVEVTSRNHTSGIAFVTCIDTEPNNPWIRRGVGPTRKSTLFWKKATPASAGKVVTIAGAQNSCAAILEVYRGGWRGGDPTTNLTVEDQPGGANVHAGFTPAFADSMICGAVFNTTNAITVTALGCTTPGVLTTRTEGVSTGGLDSAVIHGSAPQVGGPTATGNFTWTQTANATHSMTWAIRPEVNIAPPPQVSALCKGVAFNIGTGIAGSTVTVTGLGFTPKAVKFFAIGRTETIDAGGPATARRLIGFAADCAGVIKNRSGANLSEHNKAAGAFNAQRMNRSDACLVTLTTAGGVDGRARVTSFTADGFVLTIDDAFSDSCRILATCYGGSDITGCAIGTVVTPTAGVLPVVQDVTGLGFTCVAGQAVGFLLGVGLIADNAASTDARLGLGAFVQPQDGVLWSGSTDNVGLAETRTRRHCSRGRPWGTLTADGMAKRIQFTGWIADGFRLAHDEISGSAELIYYLVIKGGRWALADGLTSVSTGPVVLRGLGIGTPVGGLLVSAFATSKTLDDQVSLNDMGCIGIFSSPTNRFVVAQRDRDTVDPSVVATRIEHDHLYASIDTVGGLTGALDFQSHDPDGVTFVQEVVEDEDEQFAARRYFWCVCFGRAAGFVGDHTIGHKHWRATLIQEEPGEGPPVNQLEVVARKGKVAAPGSTMTHPARMHPGVTHLSPAMLFNGGVLGAADGEADVDLAMMTLPAGYVPGLPTDQARRQLDTLFDSDGVLLPDVLQGDGGAPTPLVKGKAFGRARHTDSITFKDFGRVFLTVPKVTIMEGLHNQPASKWGTAAQVDAGTATGPLDTAKAQYPQYGAMELTEASFTVIARLRQHTDLTPEYKALGFPSVSLHNVGDSSSIDVLTGANPIVAEYDVSVENFCHFRSKDGKPYTVIITYVVETTFDGGADWEVRSSGHLVFTTEISKFADGSINTDAQGGRLDHRIVVPGLSGDGLDRVRVKIIKRDERGQGEYFPLGTGLLPGTGTVYGPGAGLIWVIRDDAFASKTPEQDDFIEWIVEGYV